MLYMHKLWGNFPRKKVVNFKARALITQILEYKYGIGWDFYNLIIVNTHDVSFESAKKINWFLSQSMQEGNHKN